MKMLAIPVRRIEWDAVLPQLSAMAQAIENDDEAGKFGKFVRASNEKQT